MSNRGGAFSWCWGRCSECTVPWPCTIRREYGGVLATHWRPRHLLGNGVLAATWKFWEFSVSRFQTIFLLCAGLALFCVTLFFCLPSVVPKHEDYYNP